MYIYSLSLTCYLEGVVSKILKQVKTLIDRSDRTFKIINTWLSFHNDIQNLFAILRKNLYPEHVLDMLLHRYVTKAVEGNDTRPLQGNRLSLRSICVGKAWPWTGQTHQSDAFSIDASHAYLLIL